MAVLLTKYDYTSMNLGGAKANVYSNIFQFGQLEFGTTHDFSHHAFSAQSTMQIQLRRNVSNFPKPGNNMDEEVFATPQGYFYTTLSWTRSIIGH